MYVLVYRGFDEPFIEKIRFFRQVDLAIEWANENYGQYVNTLYWFHSKEGHLAMIVDKEAYPEDLKFKTMVHDEPEFNIQTLTPDPETAGFPYLQIFKVKPVTPNQKLELE